MRPSTSCRPAGWATAAGSFPFGRIQDALNAARAGDVITVAPGTYTESLSTVRSGSATAPITLRAAQPRTAIVTSPGRLLHVAHPYLVVDGLVLDGQYAGEDTVRVTSSGDFLVLRNTEVRRSSKDLIDMAAPEGVLIDGSLLHHALNAAGGRSDAHGIVTGAVRDLTIRATEIHTFSGDGLQVDPGRAEPGWDRVTIEGSKIWLAPLPAAENGFAAGAVPGENAVDTKASATNVRSRITIRDTIASGFRDGFIGNMAAFNFKEHVDATVDGVTVFDSQIAFRLRGPDDRGAGAGEERRRLRRHHRVPLRGRHPEPADLEQHRRPQRVAHVPRRIRAQGHSRRAEPALDACAHLRGEAVVEPARQRIVVRRRVRLTTTTSRRGRRPSTAARAWAR